MFKESFIRFNKKPLYLKHSYKCCKDRHTYFIEVLLIDFIISPQFKVDDLEAQLQTKDKIIQQLTEGLKDKERQMQQCMEIFKPTPQVSGGSKNCYEASYRVAFLLCGMS